MKGMSTIYSKNFASDAASCADDEQSRVACDQRSDDRFDLSGEIPHAQSLMMIIKINSLEERCEDPTVVTINPIKSHHRITPTATCNTDEWTRRIRGIIFTAGS